MQKRVAEGVAVAVVMIFMSASSRENRWSSAWGLVTFGMSRSAVDWPTSEVNTTRPRFEGANQLTAHLKKEICLPGLEVMAVRTVARRWTLYEASAVSIPAPIGPSLEAAQSAKMSEPYLSSLPCPMPGTRTRLGTSAGSISARAVMVASVNTQ